MHKFPKTLCLNVLDDIAEKTPLKDIYEKYYDLFRGSTLNNLTTIKLAEYFIDALK